MAKFSKGVCPACGEKLQDLAAYARHVRSCSGFRKWLEDRNEKIVELREKGLTYREIAKQLGIGLHTVAYVLKFKRKLQAGSPRAEELTLEGIVKALGSPETVGTYLLQGFLKRISELEEENRVLKERIKELEEVVRKLVNEYNSKVVQKKLDHLTIDNVLKALVPKES